MASVRSIVHQLLECPMDDEFLAMNIRDYRTEEEAERAGTAHQVASVVQSSEGVTVLHYHGPVVTPDDEV